MYDHKFNRGCPLISLREQDKIEPISHCDVVYKITCHDCDTSYVGQTKRQLGTKIKNFSDINKKSGSLSVIFHHRIHMNHKINWNQVKIMD